MADHDQGYKQIFSNPRMIEDLLRGFVEQDWVSEVDFSTLERVNASFVSDDLKQREEDMIWRMRLKGEWLYVYLLLEFQSRVDKFMAVRMLTYLGLLYQDLIKSGQLKEDSLLPPVLPLVLYNGRPRWKAPVEIEKLVAPAPGRLKAYQASLRYLLIDEGALKESQLKKISVSRNLAAVLFALENSHAPEQMEQAVSLLVEWLVEPQWADLRRAFVVWFNRVFMPTHFPGANFSGMSDLQEVSDMLKERVIEWTVEWERQGMEKGLKQGRQEGILQSLRDGILDVLDSRFGMVTPEITEKVRLINDPIWLKSLLRQAAKMPSIEEFGRLLVRH